MKRTVSVILITVCLLTLLSCGSAKSDAADEKIDVDLTALSSTMVYAEVYNMVNKPDDYLGKRVLMRGNFAVGEGDNRYYFACVIPDATACCSQGIEFLLDGNYTYPNDYPQIGTEITVEGVFDTYYEGAYRYCQLINASFR